MDRRHDSAGAGLPGLAPDLFVHLGSPSDGEKFFSQYDPEARASADPEGLLYRAFGLERGSWKQLFGPDVWSCGIRAARKGHFIGAPVGDPWMMSGFFLIESNLILWRHLPRHAGDHPDPAAIRAALDANRTASTRSGGSG